MKEIKIDKKQMPIIIGAVSVVIVFILIVFVYRPLAVKIRLISRELETIEQKLVVARDIIKTKDDLRRRGHLLTRKEISLAIDEITKVGRAFNINFISISPQEIEKLETSAFQRLPIYLELESKYRDVGIFLGALEELKESIVTVRNFQIQRNEEILPRVKTRLVIEMYLQGSENGER